MTENAHKETVIKGTWWLPSQPDRKLPGEITYGQTSGAKLEIFDHFFPPTQLNEPPRKFVVWGAALNGNLITLFNCVARNVSMSIPGGRSAEILSSFGIVGGHFDKPESVKFVEVTVKLSYLHLWSCTSGLQLKFNEKERSFSVEQHNVNDAVLGNADGLEYRLRIVCRLSPDFGKMSIEEDCFLILRSTEMVSREKFEFAIERFQRFLALAVGRAVYTLEITAKIDKPKHVIQDHQIFEDYKFIRRLPAEGYAEEKIQHFDMLFTLAHLTPNPSTYFANFLQKYKSLEPVCDLFFMTIYEPKMFVQQEFLALTQAVEAYHRAFIGGKYQSDKDFLEGIYGKLCDVIPQDVSADFRASLKNKFKYVHEYSLRKRLQDICKKFDGLVKPHIGDGVTFAGEVANERNRLTHRESTADSNETDWKRIWLMGEQLSLLLEICLLHEVGFEGESLAKVLQDNSHIRAIQLNR